MMKIDGDGDGQHQHQALVGALLALVFARPVDVVARGKLDLVVDLGDRLFHRAAQIAAANAVLDGDVALVRLAIDLLGAVFHFDLGQLGQRDPFAGRRKQPDVVRSPPAYRDRASGSERRGRSAPRPAAPD